MTPELKKCTDNLAIQSVTLKNLLVKLNDEIDADQFNDSYLENPQQLRHLNRVRQLENSDDGVWIYRLNTILGIRFLSEHDLNDNDNDKIKPILEIKSEFVAQYESSCELNIEEISQFGESHVYYHVWPYWREVIQSSCARLGISPIIIPAFRV